MASRAVRRPRKDHALLHRSLSMETHLVRVYLGPLYMQQEWISVDAVKNTKSREIVRNIVRKLELGDPDNYELAETFSSGGQVCKERRLEGNENPVRIQLLWPKMSMHIADIYRTEYQFYLRKQEPDKRTGAWVEYSEPSPIDTFLSAFLQQPSHKEYPDLCNLPDLNEQTLMDNLKQRFENGNIYTYVGSILISVNPFKFHPIYNPKYVKMYQNRRLGELPPHIFAVADAAYHTMLQQRRDQCIVISGESGSGKTESTNLLLHQMSALSQRSQHGVEQTILGAGPVLEAFGNAKTVHNNNSSRFGKFIQVNYKDNGMVHGAMVEKYLLEKSRIVSQAKGERNYHVFYYLLAGASEQEKEALSLTEPEDYFYLNQSDCYTLEDIDGEFIDEVYEYKRLKQSMEMVSFPPETQKRIFCVLAAVLHLGNITFKKKTDQSHHEAVAVKSVDVVKTISALLKVKEATLIDALTKRKTLAGGETVVMNHKMHEAIATRDAMAKCLYGALFDWIVLQINHALLNRRESRDHQGNSIGVLDIFGFEDFARNSFEQFCINYANEHLQYYFNQHIFKFEQEEYMREGIQWRNIEFIDNTGCLDLFARKPTGLLSLLDEECNFPGATNETLLAKFHNQHQNTTYYEVPQMRENAFSIVHYAGKVKYQIKDFREKNSDLMRHDIMLVLKNSSQAFVRELVGNDPVAVLRWAIVRAFFRAYFAFIEAGKRHRRPGSKKFGPTVRELSRKRLAQQMPTTPETNDDIPVDPLLETPPPIPDSDSHEVAPNDLSRSSAPPGGAEHNDDDNDDVDIVDDAADNAADDAADDDDDEASSAAYSQKSLHHIPLHALDSLGSEIIPYGNPRLMKRANKVMRNRSFKPRVKAAKQLRDLKAMKTLAYKTPLGPRSSNKNKTKPPSVSAQFHFSLQELMATLSKANPFFVRCIKSNVDKAPCYFREGIVLRQLRYTGMLATVKIRQSGYNYRLTFEDFIQQYQILLPKGLVSSRFDIEEFLHNLDLNEDNYQIGMTKVFLRETEKLLLDDALHQAIMKRIVCIQRWMKTKVDRKRFVKMRMASVTIQSYVRRFLAERSLDRLKTQLFATILIQKAFRGFRLRKEHRHKVASATVIQKHIRGYLDRKRALDLKREFEEEQERRRLEIERQLEEERLFEEQEQLRRQEEAEEERRRLEEEEEELKRFQEEDRLKRLQEEEEERCRRKEEAEEQLRREEEAEEQLRRKEEEEEELRRKEREKEELRRQQEEQEKLTTLQEDEEQLQQQEEAKAKDFDIEADGETEEDIEDEPQKGAVVQAREEEEQPLLKPLARDEGIPEKESSTEDLPAESEDDLSDESETPSFDLASVASSQATPPSTPSSPYPLGDAVDGGRWPPLLAYPERRGGGRFPTAVSQPCLRTQQGPRDLEIKIKPAMVKSSSEEILNVYAGSTVRLREKRVSAPLAREESLTDSFREEDETTYYRTIQLPGDQRLHLERLDVEDSLLSPGGSSTHKSPFSRAKKHFKNIMGGKKGKKGSEQDDSDDSQNEEVHVPSPMSPHRKQEKYKKHSKGSKEPWSHQNQEPPQKHKHRRKLSKKHHLAKEEKKTETTSVTWSLSKASMWQYPTDVIVTNKIELKQLREFLVDKRKSLNRDCGRQDTIFDKVFKGTLEKYCDDLFGKITFATQTTQFTYKELMSIFESMLKERAQVEEAGDSFPMTMSINAFRGFLDEFNRKKENKELPEIKEKKEKKKKDKDLIPDQNGHRYHQMQFSIPTYCELCSSLIWVVDKGYVCQNCKYTVHKKCCPKSMVKCKGYMSAADKSSHSNKRVIGVPLCSLLDETIKIPSIVEKLIAAIELNIYVVGIYRKAGAAAKIRELLKDINSRGDLCQLDFSNYHVHVLTSVMKTFLRELPEPLLSFELYDDFIRAAEIKDDKERAQTLFAVIEKLPQSNYDLLERLVFHLAKVAQHETSNKMSPTSLAIVFAPSLVRTSRTLPAQESLNHVSRQTTCIQCIILEQLQKIQHTLEDIKTLDCATATAQERLSLVRASMRSHQQSITRDSLVGMAELAPASINEHCEEVILAGHIESMQEKKEALMVQYGILECRHSSSEDDILSTDDVDSTADELEDEAMAVAVAEMPDEENKEEPVTFDQPATPPHSLQHVNKGRAPTPRRRHQKKRRSSTSSVVEDVAHRDKPRRASLTLPELTQIGEEFTI